MLQASRYLKGIKIWCIATLYHRGFYSWVQQSNPQRVLQGKLLQEPHVRQLHQGQEGGGKSGQLSGTSSKGGQLLQTLQRKLWASNHRPWSKSHYLHCDTKLTFKENVTTPGSKKDWSDLLKYKHFFLTNFREKSKTSWIKGKKKRTILPHPGSVAPNWLTRGGRQWAGSLHPGLTWPQ